jgi:serine/threonine protein kinase/Tol biopolymer transport system component
MITRERWQRIKDLFNSALQRPAAERTKFISEACEGDESLREEVESLISAHDEDDDFLNGPAYELAAEILSDDSPALRPGQSLGPYTILSTLGIGGMGEVYLAQDARLNRKIAIKLLAQEFARDEQRVRRFEQEARAASALNHPNVCIIHEIGRAEDGRHFMAMEFIDGLTLRRRMAQKRLTLKEALDVAAQVAWALEAAHAAGIVHRDIKPENIMLRRDGYVKVLDFGIAKLNAYLPKLRNVHEAPTVDHLHTAPGTLMGTVKYMSPEQLREQPIDARTDIWSLGVVLHEMVTGITPFEAPTTNETIAVILEKQAPRLELYPEEVPEEFQQLIRKALSKKRHERYQTIKELSTDLRNLRRTVSVETATNRSEQPFVNLDLPSAARQDEVDNGDQTPTILSKFRSQAIRTADYVLSEIKQHKTAAIFTGVSAVFALLFIGLNSPALFRPRLPSVSPPVMKMTPLTSSGRSVCAAISPDGKSIAHAEKRDGMQELLMTSTVTTGTSVVVPADAVTYRGITFSRDGNYLYYTRIERTSDVGILYRVAWPGSARVKIKEGVDSPISFSPNGDGIAFVRVSKGGEYSLLISGADGTGERTIARRGNGSDFSIGGPAWSPDEKTIVCGAGWWDKGYHGNLVAVNVEDGRERVIGAEQWYAVLQVAWLEDQSGLIVSANERPLSPFQLWRVPYPEGERTRLTNETTRFDTVSVSRDGATIVSVQGYQAAQILVAPDGDVQRAREIATNVGRVYGLDWTSEGKIVFSSIAGNNLNLSRIDPDGAHQTQLTANAGDNITPATSLDGRYIVFTSNRTGSLNIWRINAEDGSDPKQLTLSDGNSYPSFSPDGQWVFYDNQSSATPSLWKVSINGGDPVRITDQDTRMPVVSPDNQFIACRYQSEEGGFRGIAILPIQGGPPLKLPIPVMDWQRVQWTRDSRALMYVGVVNGMQNIWRYDLAEGSVKQLTDFKTDDQVFAYHWSGDFRKLACERGKRLSDVTIINMQR